MPEGYIIKALSGYYYVAQDLHHSEAEPIRCRARGIFKKEGKTPLVGDRVEYELTTNGEGIVNQIFSRTTELVRPPIANVDLAVLVFSVDEPPLNLQLLDKFLVHTENAGLESMICFTKRDLLVHESDEVHVSHDLDEENVQQYKQIYERIGYDVYLTSALEGFGLDPVMSRLRGQISVFAGQSGVGKSSLLNALIPGLLLETNPISMKLGRGKHTTRHVELIPLQGGGVVADTPGFSQLDFSGMEAEDLGACFIEFAQHAADCRFRGCLHKNEPDCRVQEAMKNGQITKSRYTNYIQFLDEIMSVKRRY